MALALSTLLVANIAAQAQTAASSNENLRTNLTLESIFADGYYAEESLGAMQWLPDGLSYSVVEKEGSGQKIVRVDVKTGNKTTIVEPQLLVPKEGGNAIKVESYTFTNNLSDAVIFTNSKRVWRYNTIGDFYHLNLATKTLTKIAPNAKPSSLQFAKLSPKGDRVAYVYEHNIYTQELATGRITQLTTDGTHEIINGTFDWAYEEEFYCRDGFRWSPNGDKIAFWQIDARGIGVFNMINYTDSIYSKLIPLQYPKVGTTISAAKIGVIHLADNSIKWMNIEGDPRDNYLPFMEWAESNDELLIQQLPRTQTHNHAIIANANNGRTERILTDGTDKHWVEVNTNICWFNKGREFLWLSEEDGWKHIYMISRDGKQKRLITKGNYEIMSINYIDAAKGWAYFTTSLESPTMKFLYRIKLDGKSQPEKIGSATNGTHSYNIAPGANFAIHRYSSAGVPNKTELVDLQKNKTIREMVTNQTLVEKLEALELPKQEFFRVNIASGIDLDCYMIKPANFDPNKKYPIIFYVYGEPWNLTVTDMWGGANYLFHQYLAKQGFVVASIENRGTPSPRGVEFRKCVYKKIGIIAPDDQAAGVLKICETFPFIDRDRIGIWGWSGGGSMTLNAMLKHPEIYKTGVAVAPVPNQLLYNAFYQERFMCLPSQNPQGYHDGSPVNFANNLKGNLLLIHGTGDDNVHYQGAEQMINEFIKHNKRFDMFIFPNRSHSINEGENTSLYLRETIGRYFMEKL